MKDIKILAAHHDMPDVESYETILFNQLIPVLKRKRNVHMTWLIHKIEKIQSKNIDSDTDILDIHDFKNAVEVIQKVKPNLVYIIPGLSAPDYALGLAAKFMNIPTIGGGFGIMFFTKKTKSKSFKDLILQLFQNLIKKQNRIIFSQKIKFYISKNIFLLRTQKTIQMNLLQIIKEFLYIIKVISAPYSKGWRGFNSKFAAELNFLDGNIMMKPLLDAGFKKSSLVVVGNPLYDSIFQKFKNIKSKNERDEKIRVLLLTVNMYGYEHTWVKTKKELMTKKIISEISKEKNISLTIKIHPSGETMSEYESMIKSSNMNISIQQKGDIAKFIQNADVIISSSTSTALVCSLLANKPIIIHNCFELDKDEFLERELALECKDLKNIIPSIHQIMKSNIATNEKLDKFVNDVLFKSDGHTIERISNSIINFLDKNIK
jgi:hypothetical protein